MRLIINNLHQNGTCQARSWISYWPSHNHSWEPVRLPCLKTTLLTGVLLCGYGCPAQTMPIRLGDESPNFEADPTINKGTGDLHMHCLATNRIATPAKNNLRALSVHTRWAVGTYPLRFGLEGYRKLGKGVSH
jgi:hypothetical protein